MLHKKDDPRFRYVDVVAKGEAAGFKVTDVRYSLRTLQSGEKREHMTIEMATPYTYAGEPVKAIAGVDPSGKAEETGAVTYNGHDRLPGVRPYSDCGLYLESNGRNLEDVAEQDSGTREFVVMKGSEPVAGMKALDEIGQFAAAASNYPSVATFEDYMVLKQHQYEKIKAEEFGLEASADGYAKYLAHQARFAQDPHAKLIGKFTTPEQIQTLATDFMVRQVNEEQARLEEEDQMGS